MPVSSGSYSTQPENAAGRHAPRLNPFAFISDTDFRFALLIAFVIGVDADCWGSIASDFGGLDPLLKACLQRLTPDRSIIFDEALRSEFFLCFASTARLRLPYLICGQVLLVAATLALYAVAPAWIGYRRHASRLQEDDLPGLSQELQTLVRHTGLRRAPLFLWNPLDRTSRARAFGAFGRCRIYMPGALVVQSIKNPAAFRATMLHELAHLRNGDVTKTMLAVAIWWAFVITALPIYIFAEFYWSPDPLRDAYALLDTVMFAALVILTRNAVLRARELYADVRASAWDRGTDALKTVLQGLRPGVRWRNFLSRHPLRADRLAILEQTDTLFRFSTWEALGLGFATGTLMLLALYAGQTFLSLVVRGASSGGRIDVVDPMIQLVMWSAPAIVMLLGVTIAALAIWRSVFQALMRGRRVGGVLRVSFAFAAGLTAGIVGSFLPVLNPSGIGLATQHFALPGLGTWLAIIVLVWLLLGLVLAVFLSWIAASAAAWLPVLLRYGRPASVLAVSLVLACLFILLVPLFGVVIGVAIGHIDGTGAGFVTALWGLGASGSVYPQNLLQWPAMLVLWAWPLASALLARFGKPNRSESWAWLDPAPTAALPPAQLHLRRAAFIGIAGGVAFGLALGRIGSFVPPAWTYEIIHSHKDSAVFLIGMIVSAMLIQGLLAALTVFAVPRLRTIHALFVANIAALALAVAVRLHLLVKYGWGKPGFLDMVEVVVAPITMGGMAVALLVALLLRPVARFAPFQR